MRTLLLALVLSMPALCQVWEPNGTQIRIQRGGPMPGLPDYILATAGIVGPRLTHSAGSILFPGGSQPAYFGWHNSERILERVDAKGRVTELPTPQALNLHRSSLHFWGGTAYALGTRRHPAADRADSPSQAKSRPVELWASRDFKTWECLARHAPKYPGDSLQILMPLDRDRFLGLVWRQRDGLVILHREAGGALTQEALVEGCPLNIPWLCRSPKGIVVLDVHGLRFGQFLVLDNRDAQTLRQGVLELPQAKSNRLLATLVRPDGDLLILIDQAPMEVATPIPVDAKGKSEPEQMALGLLNAKFWREGSGMERATSQLRWIVLDPSTGQQTAVPPPAGFPEKLSLEMRELQFRDPEHLEW